MGLEIVALGLILTMRFFPDTAFARLLHVHLVERPMVLERHHLLFLIITMAMLFAAGEIIAILGSADIALGMAWDISLYFDAVAVAAVVAATRHVRLAARFAQARLDPRSAFLPHQRRRERRRRNRSIIAAKGNDDEPGPAFAIAA